MGKGSDRLYITSTEWANDFGGRAANAGSSSSADKHGYKRLPFYSCALSLQPFETPVCTPDGIIFDLVHILPYLKKNNNTNPITGDPLSIKDLTRLHFHKNSDNEYDCPITFKVFNEHTRIVAIKSSGNVYSYEAVENLNIKPKNWKDLLTDEPFTKRDIITIQDPHDLSKRDFSKFKHLTQAKPGSIPAKPVDTPAKQGSVNPAKPGLVNPAKQGIINPAKPGVVNPAKQEKVIKPPSTTTTSSTFNTAHFSTNAAAASFTSTAATPITTNTSALLAKEEIVFEKLKKSPTPVRAYISIITNLGNLNVELFVSETPRTTYNFFKLCAKKYYNGIVFHRSIKHFMLQGGCPKGTGRGGESIWKQEFKDEFVSTLKHNSRGILSMANHGTNTNGSQFFICYRPAPHLDGKHSVFGKLVGGLETLDKIERIQTDKNDKPLQEIKILDTKIFGDDPFEQVLQALETGKKAEVLETLAEKKRKAKLLANNTGDRPVIPEFKGTNDTAVGKYLNTSVPTTVTIPANVVNAGAKRKLEVGEEDTIVDFDKFQNLKNSDIEKGGGSHNIEKKKKVARSGFGDFSGW